MTLSKQYFNEGMNTRKLCEMIDMPHEVIQEIVTWNDVEYKEALEDYWLLIQEKAKWDDALEAVKKLFNEDKNGLQCLAFMIWTGLRTYEEYIKKGIPLQIYLDTMKCFSRFVKEYHESYGTYGFDREWWTARELALKEFRLGELEFEMLEEGENRFLSVHIPSDTKLEKQKCREAYRKAKSFFAEFSSDYAASNYYCESWLLSPKLDEILSDTSNIINFQKDFVIDSFDPEDTGFMQWVFKNEGLSLEDVPQNTSLQRRLKVYLQNGGKIGAGKGHVSKDLLDD